jgi:TPR repeat protein
VPADHAEAVKWYQRAALQDDINAQHNLGNMYESGRGVAQELCRGGLVVRKAAEKGHPMAQANLGVMYELGHGVTQDLVQAHAGSHCRARAFPHPRQRIAASQRATATRLPHG